MIPDSVALLAFEDRGWLTAGAKERAIFDELAMTPTRYYQLLVQAMNDPAAVAARPDVASRLRRVAYQTNRLRAA